MRSHNSSQSRRDFLKKSVLATSLFPIMHSANPFGVQAQASPLKVHIFSKHLQFLNYADMAEAAAEIGFDGVDLTVRAKGHVLPDRVDNDLPKAVEAIRQAGFAPLMMTTGVQDATRDTDIKVLETAAKLGIQYYRMDYFHYPEGTSLPDSLHEFQQKVKSLGQLNKKIGITGCYHNHAGTYVGASVWEIWELLKNADPNHMGVQYDMRHAVAEGGLSWQNGLRLLETKIKTFAIKDFQWERKNGQWHAQDTPLGEGMVDFKTYFQLLKQYRIQVPVSLHLEYGIGGAERGATKLSCDKQIVFNAMKRDLQKLHDLWQQA